MKGKLKITEAMVFEGVILLFLGILIFSSFDLPARTKRLPLLIAAITVLLTIIDIGLSLVKQSKQGKETVTQKIPIDKNVVIKTLGSVGFMIATVILWKLVGFVITSVLATVAFALFMGAKNKLALVIASLLLTLGLYYVFGIFLRVPLPQGILLSWFF